MVSNASKTPATKLRCSLSLLNAYSFSMSNTMSTKSSALGLLK